MITLAPGTVSTLSPRVRRIVAPNPSVMTGPGTNTYLVGHGDLAVIDPGPAIPAHVDAIARAGDGRIRWILVTHTHEDHSPAAQALAQLTGAELWGQPAASSEPHEDQDFVPAVRVHDGLELAGAGFTLRAIHTPGHVGNHFCWLLVEEELLFTGDHIMNGSTVVILPPDGDMKDYLDSLYKLEAMALRHLAPGHGELMPEPHAVVRRIARHRLAREAAVLAAVAAAPGGTLDELLPHAYADVPQAMHYMARHSLLAHLLKLAREQRVVASGNGGWAVA